MAEPRPRPNECGTLVNPVIGDYVKVNFEGTYYPGEVIDVSDEGICVSVLHKSGEAQTGSGQSLLIQFITLCQKLSRKYRNR